VQLAWGLSSAYVHRRYASPMVMLSPMMSREASDDEEGRPEGRPMASRVVTGDRRQARASSSHTQKAAPTEDG